MHNERKLLTLEVVAISIDVELWSTSFPFEPLALVGLAGGEGVSFHGLIGGPTVESLE